MNTNIINLLRSRGTLALVAGIGLLLPAAQVKAQSDGDYQAPPVDTYSAPASAVNVFNWQDVPQNQVVPIDRAVFDQGGYQLYDQAGETIVVPFQNNNLYVMKFAVSDNGTTYFVNDAGQAPVLYIPRGAFLENATVPGARWYPFNQQFCPTTPVFLGIAPSYSDFIDIGWYPNEACYGGYYGRVSFFDGGFFGPTLNLTFIFGGHHYHDWDGYRSYAQDYPAPYHVGYFNRGNYQIGGRPDFYRRDTFGGSTGRTFYPSNGGRNSFPGDGSGFNGAGRQGGQNGYPFMNRPAFGGGNGSRPTFGGNNGSRPTFGGTTSSRPTFGGGTSASRPTFGGASGSRPSFGNGNDARPTFNGATGSRPAFGGTTASRPTFGGGTGSRPTFNGTTSRPDFNGGTASRPTFGGTTASRPTFNGSPSRPDFGGATASRPTFGGVRQAPSNSYSAPARQPFQGGGSFGNQNASRPQFDQGSQPSRGGFNGSNFGGGQPSRSAGSFGGGQAPRNFGNFSGGQTPRSNTAQSNPAPRSNDNNNNGNNTNNSGPRTFGNFNGNRGFGR